MDRQTSKALRNLAAASNETQKAAKRGWLKLSHKQRGKLRKTLGVKAGGGK